MRTSCWHQPWPKPQLFLGETYETTWPCIIECFALRLSVKDLQLCSPDASTNAWLQLKHAADTKKTGFCSAVAFAAGVGKCGLGWSFGSALCGGLGIVAIAGGATFFTANYLMSSRQEKRRKAFLQHFYDLLQECDRKSQSEGVEGFLKLLCSPVQNYKELGMAKDRIFHYPYCREKPLHDIESSVDQLLDLRLGSITAECLRWFYCLQICLPYHIVVTCSWHHVASFSKASIPSLRWAAGPEGCRNFGFQADQEHDF